MSWMDKPTCLVNIPEECDYLLTIDENGQSSNFNSIKNKVLNGEPITDTEKVLCLTGVIMSVEEYINNLRPKFNYLKEKYWENGEWFNPKIKKNERIHFHSTDLPNIRNRRNCMRKLTDEDVANFIQELSVTMEQLDFKVISICTDNYKVVKKYNTPIEHYYFATTLLLERFVYFLNRRQANGIVVFESRAKSDNKQLINCIEIMTEGTWYTQAYSFQKSIIGIYFNPKRPINNCLKSYVGIELVDLVGYPIYKHFLAQLKGTEYNGRDWKLIEKKFDGYPNYMGWGLKITP